MKISVFVLLSFLITSVGLQAQETVLAAGGDAAGSGGTSSYSVGQVVYTANSGINGSLIQGVQQPYEISIVSGIGVKTIKLEIAIYPNPTSNYLKIELENNDLENLSFQLMDLQGKVVKTRKVVEMQTMISMEELPKAIYFLHIIRNKQAVKTFKVIKQ